MMGMVLLVSSFCSQFFCCFVPVFAIPVFSASFLSFLSAGKEDAVRFLLALLRFRLLLLGEDVAKSGNIKSITVFILVYFRCCSMAWSDVFNWIFLQTLLLFNNR